MEKVQSIQDGQFDTGGNVSVVIVNWNGGAFINRCLQALMAQTMLPHEILLVDNASTDNSLKIVEQFPSVKVMAQARNAGFAGGNNIAIAAASMEAEWIALLNPDAFPESRWLASLIEAARDYPQFDVFGSQQLHAASPKTLDGVGDAYHISGLVWRRGAGRPSSEAFASAHEIFAPCAAAAMYRRSALLEVNGFDEDYFCYVEDVDLGFRLRLAGYRCLYVPKAIVHHVGSGTTGGQHSNFSLYHGHRNLVWAFVKNMPGVLFWLLLPLHLLLNVASIIWFALRGHGGVILRAKRDALIGLPKMWRKRRKIQKERVASAGDIWRVLNKGFFKN